MRITRISFLFLCSASLFGYTKKITFNVGPAWYKTETILAGASFIPINESVLEEFPITSTFKTGENIFVALTGDILYKPHKSCTCIFSAGGGILSHGTGTFIDRIRTNNKIIRNDPVCFNAHFFNTAAITELDYAHKNITLKPRIGYTYDQGKLITSTPKTILMYQIYGPCIGIKTEYEYNNVTCILNYLLTIAAYKKTSIDTIENNKIFIRFPGFINNISIALEYKKNCFLYGARIGYVQFKNNHTGVAMPVPETDELHDSSALYNKTSSIFLLGTIAYLF